ncbi:hypothetical protein CQW23_11431 [Capsicum baccatum]|uniref:ATP-dependent DNA helicase n=1 Tax=Capsicum baccatum TaxID=33114 RepID=A0A2G2WPQ1_CAPBA|nr:hypothetical protein CQW23_11431 [Capsicum baccatum]
MVALAIATSGVAGTLLSGGRTANSRFEISLQTNDTTVTRRSKQSGGAKLIKKAKLIIWDEAPMASRWTIEMVDRSFRDILDIDESGKVMVLEVIFISASMDAQREIERMAPQVHQQNIDNPGRATNPDDEDLGDEELLNPWLTTEMAAPMQRRDRQARLRPDRRAVQIPFDDDDDDLDEAGATGAIILPPLAPGAKQLKDAFLERFFLSSKRAQLRDEITNFRQLPTEALHETWERFKTKLMRCPNHHMTNVHLMEILYRSLNSVTKPVVDNAAGGSFMDLTFVQASNMLDRMTKQSRAWYTWDSEVASSTVSFGMTAE